MGFEHKKLDSGKGLSSSSASQFGKIRQERISLFLSCVKTHIVFARPSPVRPPPRNVDIDTLSFRAFVRPTSPFSPFPSPPFLLFSALQQMLFTYCTTSHGAKLKGTKITTTSYVFNFPSRGFISHSPTFPLKAKMKCICHTNVANYESLFLQRCKKGLRNCHETGEE